MDGSGAKLSDARGHAVVVNFGAAWCPACREEMPALREFERRASPDGVKFFEVDVDKDPSTADKYRVHDLPTTYLISPDGNIARRYVGPIDADILENDIVELLKRRPS